MLFTKPTPIEGQIEEYACWLSERHPFKAGAERALLLRLAKSFKLRSVSDISEDIAAFFAGEELSDFYTERALIAIRGFLRYCRWAGYSCISPNDVDMEKLKGGRPRNITMEQQVQKLKSRGLKPYKVHELLEKQYPERRIHRSSVYRWYGRVGG